MYVLKIILICVLIYYVYFISKDTEDRQKPANKTTQRKFEAHACCITRCSNSADNLNKDKNAKYKPFAVFTPSSIVNFILTTYLSTLEKYSL